mmetsp:Transcript_7869/g.9484  ORF Transcript_7869/g.9484 Transcript_7869/m.9484 type:complete len:195 (+) Transcript_7869:717-1301(+)|eukprot:CAMPEP_0170455330 /NCGR_PEP_ID=MMETSP0123-20130129/3331_1 /TAXON_ID=182087 /ORGANISM="Favella ehrenbergii, Strain Fehren 1" /LENGTH=194 /DNA_ID=CAMNT_0010718433 /DNA_START=2411 /DNA_END=2995 /DNA_ORIENTATION=+
MRTYTNCGTPDYIAPEVLRGVGASFEADIWSLGVLMCEIISGKTPFHDEDPQKIYQKVIQCKARYAPSVSGLIRSLLRTIFVADPGFRATLDQIKSHAVFKRIDWDEAQSCTMESPWLPNESLPYHNCNERAQVASRSVLPDKADIAKFVFQDIHSNSALPHHDNFGTMGDQGASGEPGSLGGINDNQFVKLQK